MILTLKIRFDALGRDGIEVKEALFVLKIRSSSWLIELELKYAYNNIGDVVRQKQNGEVNTNE